MSVADQINRIKTNIASTYTAAQAKGATMPQTQNSDNLATCVQSITTGGGGGTQFGLTAEQMLGTLDSDGNLTMPTLPSITFTGVKSGSGSVFVYKFYSRNFEDGASVSFPDLTTVDSDWLSNCFSSCSGLTSVDLSALTTVDNNGMSNCFSSCPLTSVDLSALTTVGIGGLTYCFDQCHSLTSVDLSAVTTVSEIGMQGCFQGCPLTSVNLSALKTVGDSGLEYCFSSCKSLTSVNLSALTTVGGNGLGNCFNRCKSLTTISFPALTDVQTNSFENCFDNCTALTEIHFRADAQTTIEAMTGYADKFGASNATIYFSL